MMDLPAETTKLCAFCSEFVEWIFLEWKEDNSPFRRNHDGETCYLCETFVEGDQVSGSATTFSAVRERSAERNGYHLVSEINISDNASQYILALWADEGTPHLDALVPRPSLIRACRHSHCHSAANEAPDHRAKHTRSLPVCQQLVRGV